jgi:hypothetical protein
MAHQRGGNRGRGNRPDIEPKHERSATAIVMQDRRQFSEWSEYEDSDGNLYDHSLTSAQLLRTRGLGTLLNRSRPVAIDLHTKRQTSRTGRIVADPDSYMGEDQADRNVTPRRQWKARTTPGTTKIATQTSIARINSRLDRNGKPITK